VDTGETPVPPDAGGGCQSALVQL